MQPAARALKAQAETRMCRAIETDAARPQGINRWGAATGRASAAARVAMNSPPAEPRAGARPVFDSRSPACPGRQAGTHTLRSGRPSKPHHRSSQPRSSQPSAVRHSAPVRLFRCMQARQTPVPVHSAPGQRAASIAAAGQAGSPADDSRCRCHAETVAIARIRTGIDLAAGVPLIRSW